MTNQSAPMRLTFKLLVALTAAAVVILGVGSLVRMRRELDLFETDTRRDDEFIARVLARAVGDAWKAGGESAAAAIVRDTGLTAHHLLVRWVWLDGTAPAPAVTPALLARAQGGDVVAEERTGDDGKELVTLAPVGLPDGRKGGLEVAEQMRDRDRYVQRTIRDSVLSTGLLVAALTAAGLGIGLVFIGRPTRALVQKARAVASGDLGHPIAVRQRDELGDLARELNTMCDQLAAANAATIASAEARIAAVEQLRHADRLTTVGRLASGVAHELGTPLNVIDGRAQMIAGGELDGGEVADSGRIIHEQAARMTAIVRQLLDFARPAPVRPSRISLRDVAERCTRLIASLAKKKGVSLRVGDTGGRAIAWADDGQLQQAVLNLAVNATHATPAGGTVEITAAEVDATPPPAVGGAPGRWARLRVTDSGTGIDPAIRERIFEPFFTTKGVGDGTGLGLSVTYGIVRDAGGWIDVTSTLGAGSAFSLYLPVPAAEAT